MMGEYPLEVCGWPRCPRPGTDHAHRLKKSKIHTRDEYVHGQIRLCRRHHRALDEAIGEYPHERMWLAITWLLQQKGRHIVTAESVEMDQLITRLGVRGVRLLETGAELVPRSPGASD